VSRVYPAQGNHVGAGLADQPREPHLPLGPADGLGQRRSRNGQADL
jgi:hypothetical protein